MAAFEYRQAYRLSKDLSMPPTYLNDDYAGQHLCVTSVSMKKLVA